ncbi:MAG: hypothetical protein P4L56_21000 [Candidatus Sulfopaludibacter sp.]|nr:hypothetical protein [Candidatus Sulfopaludibacter sp.]
MGDIILQCSGSNPGAALTANLAIYLPIQVTNRVNSNNQAMDATVSVDYGSGYTATSIPGQVSPAGITFNGLNLMAPANGSFNVKISGIRAAVFQGNSATAQSVVASISFGLPLDQSQVVVAYAQRGLFATLYQAGITCVGSPLPSSVSVSNLFSTGTAFASTRLTEGFSTAFLPKGSGDDTGTRFVIAYSGFPAQTQLYLPDFVAGSNAAVPSIAGDLGGAQAVGQYLPGSGTLLLARVLNADSTGTGGQATALPAGTGAIALNSASAVSLSNGAGYAVYEVIDANPVISESAQIPTFIGISNITAAATAQETVTLAPVSTVFTASQTAPVPRFTALPPASDCSIIGDCGANYFPRLSVSASPMALQAYAAGGPMISGPGYAPVNNAGGGVLNYTITVNYQSGGTGWLKLWNNPNSVEVTAITANLQPGSYAANIVVDAGQAGSVTIPVTATIVAAPATPTTPVTPATPTTPAPAGPSVVVSSVVNAASFNPTPLVPGSLGTVMGTGLSGTNVSVTFDGIPATVLYSGAKQINLLVPLSLDSSKSSSSLVVTVDGSGSAPVQVPLSPASPAVFAGGILNQDDSVNGAAKAAKSGDILQIFATGIPTGATVTVQIGSLASLVPLYAAAAPDVPGVQQVNVAVPDGLNGTVPLTVCATAGGHSYCSPASTLILQ